MLFCALLTIRVIPSALADGVAILYILPATASTVVRRAITNEELESTETIAM